ncbi:hypothetical protein EHI8A_078120 [Entamoeba histolytica HM-1:IMSS-B]|uniref:PH domain-containing protein n=5 Tax=Entamoeba histolytica TaxID=5759 RepID=C4LVL4_ENTH1|nr:uncharacterized protein EHI_103720 [Entamoeba histolytica HM-1:IMSS]EMD45964.1 PH domain containing protein [Entamoeba histolytica KU27]EMH76744.1 hypothetical protein EHI8A_078120 [Entamoeba histolytica HM-1:IMSS-B]ENY65775.1 hypothetical protein EHI7A_065620 [Entamoeba histolytica HM-1:IMSS-A]GAT92713.1 hypothetical protein conserved domain containing [Entamoeba histolytica]EAL47980.2 hypothetical protein, conserved domain containing [Entamoeba histolytica HM-1:IMSS]|eukprot:XP_653366.2 uncharacterized protein EHI_103720 [Entamoeba histolytica HM-1:IMSS]
MPIMNELNVCVAQLQPSEFQCWGEKVGGSIRTWKKRYFVLKDRRIWYFSSCKDKAAKGYIDVPVGTEVNDVSGAKIAKHKPFAMTINSKGPKGYRLFVIICDNETDFKNFFEHIKAQTHEQKVPVSRIIPTSIVPSSMIQTPSLQPGALLNIDANIANYITSDGRKNLEHVKNYFNWIDSDDNLTKYWKYWTDNLPTKTSKQPLLKGEAVHYTISVSSKADHLKWRAFGNQRPMINPMANFFIGVGIQQEEIERIDEFGSLVRPQIIGSMIEITKNFGMSENWFFAGRFDISLIRQLSEDGNFTDRLFEWLAESHITEFCQFGREVNENPPVQSTFHFLIEGEMSSRVNKLLRATQKFGFPPIPNPILNIFKGLNQYYTYFVFGVTLCNQGFVRFSAMIADPTDDVVLSLLDAVRVPQETRKIHLSLLKDHTISVRYVEYSYLKNGCGRGTFNEGSDVYVQYYFGSDAQ